MAATPSVLLTKALDARSGTLLWEHEDQGNQPAAYVRLAVSDTRLCRVGDTLLECFERSDGTLRWSSEGAGIVAFSADQTVLAVADDLGPRIWAYSADDGTLLWQLEGFSVPTSVVASGDRFLLAGVQFTTDNGGREDDMLAVDARDVRTGNLIWQDRSPRSGASAAAVGGQHLVVGTLLWASRVYDLRTGKLLADLLEYVSLPSYRRMRALAADESRYFLAVEINDERDSDFGVSAYTYH
jgi:outer membrane protein assembly factor BamB